VSTASKSGGRCASQAGFTLTELLVVAAIIGIVVGLSIPNFTRSIDNARLKTASQQLAAVYQNARLRATQTNTPYQVLISAPGVTPPQVCLDLDGDGICGAGDLASVLPAQVSLNNAGVPPGLGASELGFTASTIDQTLGIGWNGFGMPCQKSSSAAPCATVAGWVQYLQLQRSGGDVLYGAVAVSPTGRVKIWTYTPSPGGNGNWF
jgi:prepilin-type N-terminal cleavage/methylation domain-containing protein